VVHKYVMHDTPDSRINSQHAKLCELMAEMCYMITNPETEYLLIPKFAKFTMYLEHHFEYEESVMRKARYFDIDDHTAVHTQFMVTVNKIYRNAMRSTSSLKANLPVIAKALRNHIELEEPLFRSELLPTINSQYAEFS
jgi:hemerythrin-like metal-binding protein